MADPDKTTGASFQELVDEIFWGADEDEEGDQSDDESDG